MRPSPAHNMNEPSVCVQDWGVREDALKACFVFASPPVLRLLIIVRGKDRGGGGGTHKGLNLELWQRKGLGFLYMRKTAPNRFQRKAGASITICFQFPSPFLSLPSFSPHPPLYILQLPVPWSANMYPVSLRKQALACLIDKDSP